jgi:uncharacterized protein YqeY
VRTATPGEHRGDDSAQHVPCRKRIGARERDLIGQTLQGREDRAGGEHGVDTGLDLTALHTVLDHHRDVSEEVSACPQGDLGKTGVVQRLSLQPLSHAVLDIPLLVERQQLSQAIEQYLRNREMGGLAVADANPHPLAHTAHSVVVGEAEQDILAGEIVLDKPDRDPGLGRQPRERDAGESLRSEQTLESPRDLGATLIMIGNPRHPDTIQSYCYRRPTGTAAPMSYLHGLGSRPMRASLRDDLKAALKARDRVATAALRSTLAAIDNAEAVPVDDPVDSVTGDEPVVTGNEHVAGSAAGLGATEVARRHLTKADLRSIVESEVRERSVAAAEYEQLGRNDFAERLRAEAEVLSRYLRPTL